MFHFFNKKKMFKDKKSLFNKFNEYKTQKELQEYMNTNYRTIELPKNESIKKSR